jgi:acetyltransferase-like isoleucine patch superfamily enzyme
MVKKNKVSIKNVKFGKNVKIIEPVNLYGCEIGDNCFIGPFVEIQKNVVIKQNTRIQSHSFICEYVKIGKNCFIGHGVNFINDKFKNNKLIKKSKKLLRTIVMDNVKIGSNSTILPIKIENNVVIGAGSVVSKNCKKNLIYFGNPAKKNKLKKS